MEDRDVETPRNYFLKSLGMGFFVIDGEIDPREVFSDVEWFKFHNGSCVLMLEFYHPFSKHELVPEDEFTAFTMKVIGCPNSVFERLEKLKIERANCNMP